MSVSHHGAGAAGDPPAPLPCTRLSIFVDAIVRRVGDAASWLWFLLMAVIILQVAMRYLFGQGSIMFEELQWHIYGVGFLIGLSYCVQLDRHVRIDILYERWRPRTKAWVDLLGILLLLLPFAGSVVWFAVPFVLRAWELNEISAAPGGLPYRWVIKGFIVIGFGLVVLAALSRLTRCSALLFGFPKPIHKD